MATCNIAGRRALEHESREKHQSSALLPRFLGEKVPKADEGGVPLADDQNGFSSDSDCGVNRRAPDSVITMSSSRRTPNSPRM